MKEWIIRLVAQTHLASWIPLIILPLLRYVYPKLHWDASQNTQGYPSSYTDVPVKLQWGASEVTLMCLSTYTQVPPNIQWGASQITRRWLPTYTGCLPSYTGGTSQLTLMCLPTCTGDASQLYTGVPPNVTLMCLLTYTASQVTSGEIILPLVCKYKCKLNSPKK